MIVCSHYEILSCTQLVINYYRLEYCMDCSDICSTVY